MHPPVLTIEEQSNIDSGSWFCQALASRCARPSSPAPVVRRLARRRAARRTRGAPRRRSGAAWPLARCGSARSRCPASRCRLTYVEPGAWFGDIALFDGLPRTHDAHAHGATTLLVVRKADFKATCLSQHVELYDALLRLNCRRLRLMFDAVEDLNTRPLAARLAKQIAAAGRELRRRARRRDPHRPATRAGRSRPAARRLAPARQPGVERLRAGRRIAGGADAPGGAVAREAAHRPLPPSGPAVEARIENLNIQPARHQCRSPSSTAFDCRRTRAVPACGTSCRASTGPLTVEQFKGGQSNPTFKLIDAGRAPT